MPRRCQIDRQLAYSPWRGSSFAEDGCLRFMRRQNERGFAACGDAEAPARGFCMRLDRVFANIEDPGDLLCLEMLRYQPQNFPLARRQGLDP